MRRIASDSTSRASASRALRYPDSRKPTSILQVVLEPMIPFVQQLFAQRYGLRKLLMNATWGDRRHIRVSAPVETIGKFARGPNLAVGFWKVTLNRVHRDLRFEFCRLQRAIAPIGCFLLIFFFGPCNEKI